MCKKCASAGEANPRAKLTEKDVVEIRERAASGDSYGTLAADFGLSKSSVGLVVRGETWGFIPLVRNSHKCKMCGRKFEQRKKDGVYCSKECLLLSKKAREKTRKRGHLCSVCHRKRTQNISGICFVCEAKAMHQEPCSKCGKGRQVTAGMCRRCYRRERGMHPCGACGKPIRKENKHCVYCARKMDTLPTGTVRVSRNGTFVKTDCTSKNHGWVKDTRLEGMLREGRLLESHEEAKKVGELVIVQNTRWRAFTCKGCGEVQFVTAYMLKRRKYCRKCRRRGDEHPNSTLTLDSVLEIFARLDREETHKSIAGLFGVGRASISHISRDQSWKHALEVYMKTVNWSEVTVTRALVHLEALAKRGASTLFDRACGIKSLSENTEFLELCDSNKMKSNDKLQEFLRDHMRLTVTELLLVLKHFNDRHQWQAESFDDLLEESIKKERGSSPPTEKRSRGPASRKELEETQRSNELMSAALHEKTAALQVFQKAIGVPSASGKVNLEQKLVYHLLESIRLAESFERIPEESLSLIEQLSEICSARLAACA